MAATETCNVNNLPSKPTSDSLLGRRVRVVGNLATVRWGPGTLQAPQSKKPAPTSTSDNSVVEVVEGNTTTTSTPPPLLEVVGIEYDEPGLGKHDGTYQGTRLFTCKNGHGSFVKVEKVEFGTPIQKAFSEKYLTNISGGAASKSSRTETLDVMDYVDSKGRNKEVEWALIGRYSVEQRQHRLESFVEAALTESNLETRYPDDVWEGDWSLPNLKSFWLDKTLLGDWADVVSICELCPQLEWLSLAKTRLQPLTPGGVIAPAREKSSSNLDCRLTREPFVCRVRTLVLNYTMVTWQTLLAINTANPFPCLEHLHLAYNQLVEGVPELEPGMDGKHQCAFPQLKSIVLDGNGISDWHILRRSITTFPKLQALHLNMNFLGDNLEDFINVMGDKNPFRLTTLFLNDNHLNSWRAIGAISKFALLELKAQRNSLIEGETPLASPQLLRQVFIALMPSLLRLNASEITAKERIASERYFLSLMRQASNPIIDGLRETCDIEAHVVRLRTIHGEMIGGDVSEEGQATRSALFNSLVEVTLRPIGMAIMNQPSVTKRVPDTMTVMELKQLCHMLFKNVPLNRVQLQLIDSSLPFGIHFSDENRELAFYGVSDRCEIHVVDTGDMNPATDQETT